MTRAEQLLGLLPQIVADVTMYPTAEGGRRASAPAGWGCPCCVSNAQPVVGYAGWPLLGTGTLEPGDRRRLGFVFLTGDEAAQVMRDAGKFYLWEGGYIGEAVIVQSD